MRATRATLAALLGICAAVSTPAVAAGSTPPPATAPAEFRFDPREERFISPVDRTPQTYLIQEWRPPGPTTAAAAEQPLLVIYLHGSGSHQDQGMRVGIYGDVFGRMGRWLARRRAVYVCPEYRGNSWMGPAAERDLVELLRLARQRYKPRKVLLTGGSMGGTSALIFAALHPELVDGVLAWCPATDPASIYPRFPDQFRTAYGGTPDEKPDEYRRRASRGRPDALAKLPIALIHGSADAVIPVEHARVLVKRLRERKASVHYVEIENGGHDAPLAEDVEGPLEWLLSRMTRPRL